MKDFYEILDIRKDVSKIEIKKAYFSMVRKYPPDTKSNEFMEIREAYETLINEKSRKEYDDVNALPHHIQAGIEAAREYIKSGWTDEAVSILQKIVKSIPENLYVKNILGECYLRNNNTGKASTIYEQLVKNDENNVVYIGNLAKAYAGRGWRKKAIEEYYKGLNLDNENSILYLELIELHAKGNEIDEITKLIEIAEKNILDNELLANIYINYIIAVRSVKRYKNIKIAVYKLCSLVEDNKELYEDTIVQLIKYTQLRADEKDETEGAYYIINALIDKFPENKELELIKGKLYEKMKIEKELNIFYRESRISDYLIEYIRVIVEYNYIESAKAVLENDIMDTKEAMLTIDSLINSKHLDIIENYNNFKDSIDIIENDYPNIYKLSKEFFDNLKIKKKRDKMNKRYKKNSASERVPNMENLYRAMMEMNHEWDGEEEEEEDFFWRDSYEIQEPFRREEFKIGRNDQCSCGSGKKYKKCCGK